MTSLDRLPPVAETEPPGHAGAVDRLRAGAPITCVQSDDPAARKVLLQAVIDTVADMETRFVHVGNPLRSPLTIERVFLQAVGPEAEVRLEREPATLARILAEPVGDESRLIVVIDQAETLDAEALQLLAAMAGSFAGLHPRVQLLFCGPSALEQTLQLPALEPQATLPQMPRSPAPRPVALACGPTAPAVTVAPPAPEPAPVAQAVRRRRAPAVAFGLLAALAAAGVFVWQRHPELLDRARLLLPASARAMGSTPPPTPAVVSAPAAAETRSPPPAKVPAAPAVTPAASPATEDRASLRREFDRFLGDRPATAGLSEAQRDSLFQEFLARRPVRSAP